MNQENKEAANQIFIVFQQIDIDKSHNKSYTVNGDHHTIINQSQQLNEVHQNNNSILEIELLKKDVEYLKKELEFTKQQLVTSQRLLNKSLSKNK